MVPNRLAATGQVVAVPVIMATTNTPIDLGWIQGTVEVYVTALYLIACVIAFIWANSSWSACAVAGIGTLWWCLRAATVVAIILDQDPATRATASGVAYNLLMALAWGCFYQRTIFRLSYSDQYNEAIIRMAEERAQQALRRAQEAPGG